jgi:hypothetical protein
VSGVRAGWSDDRGAELADGVGALAPGVAFVADDGFAGMAVGLSDDLEPSSPAAARRLTSSTAVVCPRKVETAPAARAVSVSALGVAECR